MRLVKIFYIFIIAFLLANICHAQSVNWQNDKLEINLYSKKNSENKINTLVKISLKNGWFISWDNPGDAGTPTNFNWNIPTIKINQSIPQKVIYDDIVGQYGYSDTAYYLFESTTDKNILSVNISWEACKQECIKENIDLELNIDNQNISEFNQLLHEAKQTFAPKKVIEANADINYKNNEPYLNIEIEKNDIYKSLNSLYFIPYQKYISYVADKQIFAEKDNKIILSVKLIRPTIPTKGGLLFVNNQAYRLGLIQSVEKHNPSMILYVILLAFLGGIILNFMPCVFPVLSIKAMSTSFEKTSKKSAYLYFIGVVSCFLSLAVILYILRLSGAAIGWGFQLQSPVFVSIMLVLFIIFFLMMLNIITISPKLINWLNKKASLNSFMSGFFSVLIASPCTGPFLGAALGYTLIQSPWLYLIIFLSLGIGYALPFTLLELHPKIISKILPKSGAWMLKIKYILSIPIFLTIIWLGWVLFHQLNITNQNSQMNHFKTYNENQILSLINSGKPVFIEYTAKWCLTCLLNEKVVLNTEEFAQFAQKNNITLFRADWTDQDFAIGQSIKSYSRNSVPLYVYYPPKYQNYIILPQILNFDIVKSVLNH